MYCKNDTMKASFKNNANNLLDIAIFFIKTTTKNTPFVYAIKSFLHTDCAKKNNKSYWFSFCVTCNYLNYRSQY